MNTVTEWLDKRAKAPYTFKEQSTRAVKFSDALEAIEKARKEELEISVKNIQNSIEATAENIFSDFEKGLVSSYGKGKIEFSFNFEYYQKMKKEHCEIEK